MKVAGSKREKSRYFCFSPVAGILLVERDRMNLIHFPQIKGFSPVAGILLVERPTNDQSKLATTFVSVPLPGFY